MNNRKMPSRGRHSIASLAHGVALGQALLLFGMLVLPLVGLVLATTPADFWHSVSAPQFRAAMWLSAYTTFASVVLTVVCGTPLAWWLATQKTLLSRMAYVLVELPIVVPPAVVGIALLFTFGRQGVFGGLLGSFGISLPFTTTAVILAQVVVSAPFYVQAATSTFRSVPEDLLTVARTLGASSLYTFIRVTLPLAKPGLIAGMSIAWARALGEFGATLLFAGSFEGVSRTMPLAIYSALESDTRVAVALSLTLASMGTLLLFALRAPRMSSSAHQVYA